jgi:outer membrane murein-binding lipoprotein Lpp
MENITAETAWTVVAGVLAAVVLVGNAAEKIAKVVQAYRAPNARQDERLTDLEAWREKVDAKLQHDHDSNRVTQRALLALLDHGIDGNNIEQMQHAKEELQNHLINR